MRLKGPNGIVSVTPGERADIYELNSGGFNVDFVHNGYNCEAVIARDGPYLWVSILGHSARFSLPDSHSEDADHEARAPMTGKVVSIPVKIGDEVKRGETVAVLEAMKMEYKLGAEADGIVEEVGAKEGELVDLGQLLVKLK